MRPRHPDRGLAGREVLGRVETAVSRRHRAQDRDWAVDRKVGCAAAQIRRRADAIRTAVSRRRRRAYRAPDRGQGPQPRDLGRLLSPARLRGAFPEGRGSLSGELFGYGVETRLGVRTFLLVADQV